MLRIQPSDSQESFMIRLSGRIMDAELSYVDELVRHANGAGSKVVLDLEQVTVLGLSAVRYLAEGEGSRFVFACCPAAIREWIKREKRIVALASSNSDRQQSPSRTHQGLCR